MKKRRMGPKSQVSKSGRSSSPPWLTKEMLSSNPREKKEAKTSNREVSEVSIPSTSKEAACQSVVDKSAHVQKSKIPQKAVDKDCIPQNTPVTGSPEITSSSDKPVDLSLPRGDSKVIAPLCALAPAPGQQNKEIFRVPEVPKPCQEKGTTPRETLPTASEPQPIQLPPKLRNKIAAPKPPDQALCQLLSAPPKSAWPTYMTPTPLWQPQMIPPRPMPSQGFNVPEFRREVRLTARHEPTTQNLPKQGFTPPLAKLHVHLQPNDPARLPPRLGNSSNLDFPGYSPDQAAVFHSAQLVTSKSLFPQRPLYIAQQIRLKEVKPNIF